MLATDSQEKIVMEITLYTRALCGWCQQAKSYLRQRGLPFREVDVGADPAAYAQMQRLSGQSYVPTIVVNGHVLADFDVAQLEQFLARLSETKPTAPAPPPG